MDGAFILSEAAEYAFRCQDVYADHVSFAAAIPDHLRPIFLIPVKVQFASSRIAVAVRIADGITPSGATPEGELFSYQTFKYEDTYPTVPNSDPGSIFENDAADDKTHHQEYNFDQNIQSPTNTTFNTDVDTTQYTTYPYRTPEKPVRKSSTNTRPTLVVRLAIKEKYLKSKTPKKIKENAKTCTVNLVKFDPESRIFLLKVKGDDAPRNVEASLSDTKHVSMNCDCPFWRYNGPEYHAKRKNYLLGQPFGTAVKPEKKDPDSQYWLCKHTFAVLKRLERFVDQIAEENPEADEDELMDVVDAMYYRLEPLTEEPLEEISEDVAVQADWDEPVEAKYEPMKISSFVDCSDW